MGHGRTTIEAPQR